ncbi:hypothetical protein ACHQM5_016658 [Ranunculus cassubicifolius]
MEFTSPAATPNLSSPLSSFISHLFPYKTQLKPTKPPNSSFLITKSSKKNLKNNSKKSLSRILRTELAIQGIERKANSNRPSRLTLWPKSLLQALDDAINNLHYDSALKIFDLLRKQRWYTPKCQTYTKLFVMLGKCRKPGNARILFEEMCVEGLKPSVDVYTALVSVYGLSGCFKEAFDIVEEMKSVSDCAPDEYTYSVLIKCCCKFRRFDLIGRILGEMSYLGVSCSVVMYNTIIDGYGKSEMFELMENCLTDMIENNRQPDVYTLNSFIWAYGNAGRIKEMESWYDEFYVMGVQPDITTFNTLIRSYGKAGMHDKLETVMEFMKKRFFSPTTMTYNIIIEMFGSAENIEKMEYYFREMKYAGVKPNCVTYTSLVSSYSKAGEVKKISSILRQVENSDVILDTTFFNCVISAYGQAGKVEKMKDMFDQMKQRNCKPDSITFDTMILAYNAQGMTEAAQDLETSRLNTKDDPGNRWLNNSKREVQNVLTLSQ